MTIETVSTPEEWRRLAQLMQAETDPTELMELAQKLIDEFDKHQSRELPEAAASSKSTGSCMSEAQDEDAVMHGDQHGTKRPTQ